MWVWPPRAFNYPSMNEFSRLEMSHRIQISWSSTNRKNVKNKCACYQSIFPSQACGELQSTHSRILSMNLPLQYAGKVILIFDDETTSSRGTFIKYLKVSPSLFLSISMRGKQTCFLDLMVTGIFNIFLSNKHISNIS